MPSMTRASLARLAIATSLSALMTMPALAQEKTLRIAMTAADIPKTTGQPDQGFEGNRFTGIPLFDALTHFDLSSADKASVLIPGLATEWKVSDADKTKWTFKLRPGVKFHDGSPVNAASIVWNVQKVLDKEAAHFAPDQIGVTVSRMPNLASGKVIDDLTVELTTKEPDIVPAAQPDQPVHRLAVTLAEEVRRTRLGRRQGGTRQAGLGRLRGRRIGIGPLQDGQVPAA